MNETIMTINELSTKLDYGKISLSTILDNYQLNRFLVLFKSKTNFYKKKGFSLNHESIKIFKKIMQKKAAKTPALYKVYLNLCKLERELNLQ